MTIQQKNDVLISVIMSVYNTKEEYLREAIESILNQTMADFEFIIVDDASDADTKKVLHSYEDDRIIIITNDVNQGLTVNLNKAIERASGKYIARMDADDVSMDTRFEKMSAYMDKNDDVNVLGCYMDCGDIIRKYGGTMPHELRKALLLFDNIGLGHPSVMLRKSFLDGHNIRYNEYVKKSQDFELWTQCIKYTNLYVYPECLMKYRVHDGQISSKASNDQIFFTKYTIMQQLKQFIPYISDEDIDLYSNSAENTNIDLKRYKKIERSIKKANRSYGIYSAKYLNYAMKEKYIKYLHLHYLNLYRIHKYIISPLDINSKNIDKMRETNDIK